MEPNKEGGNRYGKYLEVPFGNDSDVMVSFRQYEGKVERELHAKVEAQKEEDEGKVQVGCPCAAIEATVL